MSQLTFSAVLTTHGIQYQLDQFQNTWIQLIDDIIEFSGLDAFISETFDKRKTSDIYVTIPTELLSSCIPIVEKHKFVFHAHTFLGFEYIRRSEESSAPIPMTATLGAQAIVVRNKNSEEQVLIVQNKHRPTRCGFVGGYGNRGEIFEEIISREIREETGLQIITFERLLAIRQRKDANRYHADDICAYYVIRSDDPDEELVLQKSEISNAIWVPIKDIEAFKELTISVEFELVLDYYMRHREDRKSTGHMRPDLSSPGAHFYYQFF